MSTAISIYHGVFGRAALYRLDRPMTRHAHREGHLILHVRGGRATVNVRDEPCDVSPAYAAAVNPWELHDFVPGDLDGGQLCLVLYIKPMWFLDFGRTAGAPLEFGSSRIEVSDRLSRLITKAVALLLDGASTDRFDGYLYELTEECFERSSRARGPEEGIACARAMPLNDARVRRSITLMTESLGAGIELDVIARESGLSRPHFFKLFRRHTGLTPHLYLNTLRMEKAIERLTETDQSVSEIGFDLGFSSQSSFTRFFSSNVGMAPTCYRRVAHLLNP